MAYDNEKSGVLFRNKQKEPNSKHPDYTGKLQIDGKEWRLAAWVKEGAQGKFFSLKLTDPNERQGKPQGNPMPQPADEDLDDLPF